MNSKTINQKLSDYFALESEVHGTRSHSRRLEFVTITRELAALIDLPPDSEYETIVTTAYRVIGELEESERLDDHRRWLGGFNRRHLRNWEKQLQHNPDGAKCEMFVRILLEENGNKVAPNVDLSGKTRTPDFRCTQAGKVFFVEVTCIDANHVTKETELEPSPQGTCKAYAFGDINQTLFEKMISKTSQCKDLKHPALVAICTLHFQASALTFDNRFVQKLLTGTEYITAQLGGVEKPSLSTKLEYAAFIQPDSVTGKIVPIHQAVSGLMLCGFGCEPPTVNGLLHPEPLHAFDRTLVKKLPFFRLASGYETGLLTVETV